jgi:4-amino-4-deoxy-L-arabinose transferase-like glycosyltransferase
MKWLVLSLCVICSFLFLSNLQSRDFWAPDEGDFAEIARETHNNPLVPHLNNTPYGEKPPLFYYITYGSHRVLHLFRDEASMRVPTALAALCLAVFFFFTVGKFLGKKESISATAILVSAPLYYWQARYLQVDMVFAVFVAGSMLSFLRFHEQGARVYYYLFFLLAALAFMTKGPVSIALIFPSVFIYLLLRKDYSLLKRKETYAGLLILAAIIVPWYAAVYLSEGFPYLYENIIRQNLLRFFDAWSHKRPFYYYFTTLPLDFFPWSLFLPLGMYLCLAHAINRSKTAFFLIWSGWMFLFLSLSSGKISKYMLPLLPAISVITSHAFLPERSKYRTGMFAFLAAFFLAFGCLLFFYRFDLYPEFRPERIAFGVLSVALFAALALCLWKRDSFRALGAVFFFMALVYGIANLSVYEKWNSYKSPRPVTERIKPYIKDGTPWIFYGSMRGAYVYYVGAYAVHVNEHDTKRMRVLGKELKSFFILTRKRDMNEVSQSLPGVRTVFEEKIGDTVMVFAAYDGMGGS